jgi:hypothetical protein
MVDDLVERHLDQYHASGAELILGDGEFTGPRTLNVSLRDGGERLSITHKSRPIELELR